MKKYMKFLGIILGSLLFISGANILYAQDALQPSALLPDAAMAQIDTTPPLDVENLKVVPGDSEIQLAWDAVTDNVGVVGYKIYRGTHSVKNTEDQYDLPVIPVGNIKTYIVKNLTNNQIYYFSITAVDAAGNESVNYAPEASATPQSGLHLAAIEDDGKAPEVKKVEVEDSITIKVVFSEAIELPEEQPQSAFKIEKTSDKSKLEVQKAEIDTEDKTGATVLLTLSPQEEGAEYLLTTGIEIEDYFGNPIISGTSDTGSFKGSAKKKQEKDQTQPPADIIPPADTATPAEIVKDLVPPEDVTKLIALIKDAQKNIVEVRWQASKNSAKDLANQVLYQSNDKEGKKFGSGTSLGATATAAEVQDLKPLSWYTFKVATKDLSGNESKGIMTSIFLPQTGPGIFAIGLTSLLMGFYSKLKKK